MHVLSPDHPIIAVWNKFKIGYFITEKAIAGLGI